MAFSSIATTVRNAMCDAFVDAIDVGSTDPSGDIQIRTSGGTTLLAELAMSAPAFGSSSSGTATASAITDDSSADATGTAAVGRFRSRDNTTVADFTVGTSGADLNLNTTSITSGDRVSISSCTVTMPAS